MKKVFFVSAIILTISANLFAQQKSTASSLNSAIKSSPAYAEVLLRRAELSSEVESLLESYTDDYPKVKESRYELGLIQKDLDKLLIQTDGLKLSSALGKLLIRRAELNTDLWALQSRLSAEHPDVKRARRKVAGFDEAIKEIMP